MSDTNPILFFSPGACSFGAIVALEWVAKPYWLCRVEKAQRSTDAYKRINPHGAVPAYKTGERIITENIAILKHIAALAPEKNFDFKPGTPEADMMNMVLSYYSSGFHVVFYPFFAPQRYHDDERIQAEIKQKAINNIRSKYEFVEKCFAGCSGNSLHFGQKTIADPYFYGMARWGTNAKIFEVKTEYPNIGRFMNAMEADPAVKFALAAEAGEVAKSPNGCKGFVRLEDVELPQRQAA